MQKRILDLFRLNGRVALIVGGNRGLGLSMAKALAEAGANISIASRDEERNRESAGLLKSTYNIECVSFYCDVTKENSVKAAVANTVQQFGKIDILINSAGINVRGAIE